MAMQFFNSLRGMKVKDVPAYVRPMLTREKAKNGFDNFIVEYKRKYIDTGSIKPLHHVLIGVGLLSYFVALPHERRHLRHLQEEAKHGKGHGH